MEDFTVVICPSAAVAQLLQLSMLLAGYETYVVTHPAFTTPLYRVPFKAELVITSCNGKHAQAMAEALFAILEAPAVY